MDFGLILGFHCFNGFWWWWLGGDGWVVMVGRCGVDGGICVLVVVLLQVL